MRKMKGKTVYAVQQAWQGLYPSSELELREKDYRNLGIDLLK